MIYRIELYYNDFKISKNGRPEKDPAVRSLLENKLRPLAAQFGVKPKSIEPATMPGKFINTRYIKRIAFTADDFENAWRFAKKIKPNGNGNGKSYAQGTGFADMVKIAW